MRPSKAQMAVGVASLRLLSFPTRMKGIRNWGWDDNQRLLMWHHLRLSVVGLLLVALT